MAAADVIDAVNLLRLLRCTEQMACASELDRELLAIHVLELRSLFRRVDLGPGDVLSAAEVDDARRRVRLLDELARVERSAVEPAGISAAMCSYSFV